MKQSETCYQAPQQKTIPLCAGFPLCASIAGARTESYDEFESLDGIVH
ncbi:MAG: hypothetical protein J6T35_08355 [Bacteroidales bacterium]|nr:hypothetical protein [Bacteroidales bacterium]